MGYLHSGNNSISLLYVEDEPLCRELLHKVISRKFPTIKIHTAEDGKVGLELFKKVNPEIVLTDIDLPVMNGILMMNEIRRLNSEVEIIILSGDEKTLHDSDCVGIGISHYLNKPLLNEVLFDAIEHCLCRINSIAKETGQAITKGEPNATGISAVSGYAFTLKNRF